MRRSSAQLGASRRAGGGLRGWGARGGPPGPGPRAPVARVAVGIDLGTTNSAVAVAGQGDEPGAPGPGGPGGAARVLLDAAGRPTTPSVVAYPPGAPAGAAPLVGEAARRQAAVNEAGTFFSAKRLLGRRPGELDNRIFDLVPYEISDDVKDRDVELVLRAPSGRGFGERERRVRPGEVAAAVLAELKRVAEARLGTPVTEAVVSVPAYFGTAQREATAAAAEAAGLKVLRIINEPAAAALAYGYGQAENEFVCVFDLGGGTFDVSVLQIGDQVLEVLSSGGDNFVGGDDFDACIVDWLIRQLGDAHRVQVQMDPVALHRLREAAELCKTELSLADEAEVDLPFLVGSAAGPVDLRATLTRAEFEQITGLWVDYLKQKLLEVTAGARTAAGEAVPLEAMNVVLVGGATRMPAVRALVGEVFGREPELGLVNPDEAVALGAAISAAAISGGISRRDVILLDETPDVEDFELLAQKVEALLAAEGLDAEGLDAEGLGPHAAPSPPGGC